MLFQFSAFKDKENKMKKLSIMLVVVGVLFATMCATVQATPDKAINSDKTCGDCHSGGRHHGK